MKPSLIHAVSLSLCCLLAGCGGADTSWDGGAPGVDSGVAADGGGGASPEDAGEPADGGEPPDAGSPDAGTPCPPGQVCVDQFPFTHAGDSAVDGASVFNAYGCAPTLNESGNERIYRVTVPADGFLSAAVRESPGVDVDVHILSALDAQACLSRGNFHAKADVSAGTYYVVVDTFVSAGVPQAGAYELDIGFLEPSVGPCDLQSGVMPRVNDNGNPLSMPATGKVVKEAHLVTQEEPAPYPASPTDELEAHHALSQSRTGLVMHRSEPWAPLEGGSFYGCGIGNPSAFPVEHEAWYVNMYWTSAARPAKGTRMIFTSGARAVVVAAGYETGPGDLSFIGGTTEETHFYMGTTHGSVMTLGIAVDQSLPLGPRTCTP
jgi:hypothetical protein